MKSKKFPSELRFDLVSKDWVVIATGRARRPESFQRITREAASHTTEIDPFESLDNQEPPVAAFYKGKQLKITPGEIPQKWTTISIPNKYPAFSPNGSAKERHIGPYQVLDGIGFHEVVVTKDAEKELPQFSTQEARELIDMYHARYVSLEKKDLVNYISIFKNKGPTAGATVAHPHSQLIATPVTDPDIQRSLRGSAEYAKKHKKCVHCVMLAWDRREKSRIIFENKCMIVVCPFASRVAFEIRIFPSEHLSHFERINECQKQCLAQALQVALKKLYKGLKDPDYNYFLHTAPADKGDHGHYHWHWEILPRTSNWAGFELGTGIEISTIEPEKAAAFLCKQ